MTDGQQQHTTDEWFKEWFNSPFYHVLYKHRDEQEAHLFIDNLLEKLSVKSGSKVLDLACGRGRHSLYLNSKGYDVTGIDYSTENIRYARQFANDSLHFEVHDMRLPLLCGDFGLIVNLFTSFGYFDSKEEDLKVLVSCKKALLSGGLMVLDFQNTKKILANLVQKESKQLEGITFNISRELKNGFVYKHIEVINADSSMKFFEKVRAITHSDFMELFAAAGLNVLHVFGNYDLAPFNDTESNRMIFVVTP